MKWIIWLVLTFAFLVNTASSIRANEDQVSCENRYLTLINPVRGRDLWHDKSLVPIESQYQIIQKNGFPATWLLQYDTLEDPELFSKINSFDSLQEKGVFLEISEKLTEKARVLYPIKTPWFSPDAVFLSGYSQSERRALIDALFNKFKEKFGYYPKSVGAWWIDSYSLDYMKQKYQITSAMIVADQKTTDNYGVWGQWWGVPFYPSKANILTPASTPENKQNVVIIQWAQRDPMLAYGEGPLISNFSLQANDYMRQGKNTDYFKEISDTYLSCDNKLGQITVGLETGIESVGYLNEYSNQLEYLKTKPNLKAVIMSQFADEFAKVYPQFPESNLISYSDSIWNLSTEKRENKKLQDLIYYSQENSFSDYFISDNSEFLNRRLDKLEKGNTAVFVPYYLVVFLLAGILLHRKKEFPIFVFGSFFLLSAYGLLLRSNAQYGWTIYYGAIVEYLQFIQVLVCLAIFSALFFFFKQKYSHNFNNSLFLSLLPLSFGFDFLLSKLRFSIVEDRYLMGFALDTLRFLGMSFSRNFHFEFINQDFEGYQLDAFLKFNYEKIWQKNILSVFVFPLVHILLAFALFFILRNFPRRIKIILISLLTILWLGYIFQVINTDPWVVLPNI